MKRKLAISLSGEGFGHVSRVLALLPYLQKRYDVYIWAPEHVHFKFQGEIDKERLRTVPFLKLFKKNNSIQLVETALYNIEHVMVAYDTLRSLEQQLHHLKIDAVLSDYEPFLAYAARGAGLPLVLLNHQGVLSRAPAFDIDALLARFVNYLILPDNERLIVVSFFNGDVGPLIRKNLRDLSPETDDFILVYVKENNKDQLMGLKERFPTEDFRYYPDPEATLSFEQALASCKAVIAPAGHQLMSEALYFNKPMLVIPEKGQFEQKMNADMLELSGRGRQTTLEEVHYDLETFLGELASYPRPISDTDIRFNMRDNTLYAIELIDDFLQSKFAGRDAVA